MRSSHIAAAGLGLALLVGCGGGAAKTATSVSSTPSGRPSPSPTADAQALSHQLNLRTLKIACATIGSALRYVDQRSLELGQLSAKQAMTSLQGIDKTDNDVAVDSTGLAYDLAFTQFVTATASSFAQARTDYSNICLTKRGFPPS